MLLRDTVDLKNMHNMGLTCILCLEAEETPENLVGFYEALAPR